MSRTARARPSSHEPTPTPASPWSAAITRWPTRTRFTARRWPRHSPTRRRPTPVTRTPSPPSGWSPLSQTRIAAPTCTSSTRPATTGRSATGTSASTAASTPASRARRCCSPAPASRCPASCRRQPGSSTSRPPSRLCAAGTTQRETLSTAGHSWASSTPRPAPRSSSACSGTAPTATICSTSPAAATSPPWPARSSAAGACLGTATTSTVWRAPAGRGAPPAVARLLERGGALLGGAVAEFPSVTLVNHTSALTGVGPGRHGIVGNVYFDRSTGAQVLANDAATWHLAGSLLRPGVRTVFEALRPEAEGEVTEGDGSHDPVSTACINEPTDRGADYSTLALVRSSGSSDGSKSLRNVLPDPALDLHATQRHVAACDDYAWSTQVDAFGLVQMQQLFSGTDPRWPTPPRLTWWNTTLTDAAHHEGGPYSDVARASLADADRRLNVFLDLLEARGLLDSAAFLLTADHGSEGADPSCTGDWDVALERAGVVFRDEGYGAIYLG